MFECLLAEAVWSVRYWYHHHYYYYSMPGPLPVISGFPVLSAFPVWTLICGSSSINVKIVQITLLLRAAGKKSFWKDFEFAERAKGSKGGMRNDGEHD